MFILTPLHHTQILISRKQRYSGNDHSCSNDVILRDSLAEHEMANQQRKHDSQSLEHIRYTEFHPLDDLLPKDSIDAQHRHRSAHQQNILPTEERIISSQSREHTRTRINGNCPDQHYVWQYLLHATHYTLHIPHYLNFAAYVSEQPRISAFFKRPLILKYLPFLPHGQSSSPKITPLSSVSSTCPG